jgi:PAS domain S-box-containing protein
MHRNLTDRHDKRPSDAAPRGSLLKQVDLLSMIDAFPHGVLLMNSARRVISINRLFETLVGYSRASVLGVGGEFVLRSSLGKEGDPVGAVLESGQPLAIEGDIINRSLKKIPVRFTISPLKSYSGEKAGVIVVVEDISVLKDLDDKVHGFPGVSKIIGHSGKMIEIFDLLPIVARTDASVLITGETGTGKDLLAEAIHKSSKRAQQPFIKVNCGALPESLLESELFGHARGAFTGADRDKPGMFKLAHGGTIFLTEIGDLPLPLQVKLLTVLDDKEFFPVGGSKKTRVDVRIIAATHRDLSDYVRQGKFREDLFYRLNVLRLHIPALREREDDFRLLLDHFLREFNAGLNKNIKGFSEACLDKLSRWDFPGNVRELRNIVEYAVNICQGDMIQVEHLPAALSTRRKKTGATEPFIDKIVPDRPEEEEAARRATMPPPPALSGWKEMERKMIMESLVKTGGKKTKAAELLGWGRSTLWRKIKLHGLA